MKNYEFWFVVGSQTAVRRGCAPAPSLPAAQEMAEKLSAVLPYPLKYKVTAKSNAEILDVVKEANYNDACAGIVTWCHTFCSVQDVDQRSGAAAEAVAATSPRSITARSPTKRSTWTS